jgi:hypothetical protein
MTQTPVYANVYKLIMEESQAAKLGNQALEFITMGVYHTGIEILGQEYAFGLDPSGKPDPEKDGIFVVSPRSAVGCFKEQVLLGTVAIQSRRDLQPVIASLKPRWKAVTYNILSRNCCHFALDFAVTLSAGFQQTFPHYVLKSSSVGDFLLPAALTERITKAISPPTSVDPALLNKIDVAISTPAPPPLAAKAPKAVAAKPSGGLWGTAFSLVTTAADTFSSVVSSVVDDSSRNNMVKAFPDVPRAELVRDMATAVVHIHREQPADVYLTSQELCIAGENGLSVRVPLTAIKSIQYGAKIPPPAPGLPPTFQVTPFAPPENGALLIFLADGRMIPFFDWPNFVTASVVGKIAGADQNARMESAFRDIDLMWRKLVRVA